MLLALMEIIILMVYLSLRKMVLASVKKIEGFDQPGVEANNAV